MAQIYQIPAVKKLTLKICGKSKDDGDNNIATSVNKKETVVQMIRETSDTIVQLFESEKENKFTEKEKDVVTKIKSVYDTVGYLVKLLDFL